MARIPGLGFAKEGEVLPPLVDATHPRQDEQQESHAEATVGPTHDALVAVMDSQDVPGDINIEGSSYELTLDVQGHDLDAQSGARGTEGTLKAAESEAEADEKMQDAKTNTEATVPVPVAGESSCADALEAALDSMLAGELVAAPIKQNSEVETGAIRIGADSDAGWEVDSSPYASSDSSSDTSSDSDSDDSDAQEPGQSLEEVLSSVHRNFQGRSPVQSKNENSEEVLPKPNIIITPEMEIRLLGEVRHLVKNRAVISSCQSGRSQVLGLGAVLCLEDRRVIGALADIIGGIEHPLYTVGFQSEEEVKQYALSAGSKIFFSVQHSDFVFTDSLKGKGYDASNLYDEELGSDDLEFSDDEKEAQYKRARKVSKQGSGRGGRGGASTRQGQQLQANGNGVIKPTHDEDSDGPYKPLARPATLGMGAASLPPRPDASNGANGFPHNAVGNRNDCHRGSHRGNRRGQRGDFRGRGNRNGHRAGQRGGQASLPAQAQGQEAPHGFSPPAYNGQAAIPPPIPAPYHWPAPFPGLVPFPGGVPSPGPAAFIPPPSIAATFNLNLPGWNQSRQSQAPMGYPASVPAPPLPAWPVGNPVTNSAPPPSNFHPQPYYTAPDGQQQLHRGWGAGRTYSSGP